MSLDSKKNLKYFSPAHVLSNMSTGLKSINAITTPNIGRKLNMTIYTNAGKASKHNGMLYRIRLRICAFR